MIGRLSKAVYRTKSGRAIDVRISETTFDGIHTCVLQGIVFRHLGFVNQTKAVSFVLSVSVGGFHHWGRLAGCSPGESGKLKPMSPCERIWPRERTLLSILGI